MGDFLCAFGHRWSNDGPALSEECPWCKIEQLRIRAEDAEMLAERRKWGAEEMDRLRARVDEMEAHYDEQVCLKCMHSPGIFFTTEQINAAVEYAVNLARPEPEDDCANDGPWIALNILGIHRCEECGGSGDLYEGSANWKVCPDCAPWGSKGWVIHE